MFSPDLECICNMQLLRAWGHIDGYGTIQTVQFPMQPSIGVFSEAALRRYDFVLDALSRVRLAG